MSFDIGSWRAGSSWHCIA